MSSELATLLAIIKRRRSVFPIDYTKEEIPAEVIRQILDSANYAPTHKLTQPWRFVVFRKQGRMRLGNELARLYKASVSAEKFLQKKYESILDKAEQSSCIITLNVQLHPDKLPEWEEVAALACAVQNMALTAEASKVGAYWSSPEMIGQLNEFLELKENEKCYGLFYMGYHKEIGGEAVRRPIEEKVRWVEE